LTVELGFLDAGDFQLPEAFYRDQSVLIFPSTALWQNLIRGGLQLKLDAVSVVCRAETVVTATDVSETIENYVGQAMWLGIGKRNLEPPARFIKQIVEEHQGDPAYKSNASDKRSFRWALRRPAIAPIDNCENGVEKIAEFRLSLLEPASEPGKFVTMCERTYQPARRDGFSFTTQILEGC
jgi:hypothetical protein